MSINSAFLTLIIVAACSDLWTRRVPNALNFTLLLSGVFAATLGWLAVGWDESILGVLVAFAMLLLPFAMRVYQGGDVKLCMGMGAWLGVDGVLWTVGLGIVGGGVLALFVKLSAWKRQDHSEELTVPMAVSFSLSGATVYLWGAPPW